MKTPAFSESEWVVMEALWERSPQTAAELTVHLQPAKNWAQNTVRTLLTRLQQKKVLRIRENANGTRNFSPAVAREDSVGAESQSFLQKVFRGAAQPLLVHFVQQARLTPSEVRELKRLLDRAVKK